MKKQIFLSVFVVTALAIGVFGIAQTVEAAGSYMAPLFTTPSFSLDSAQNQLTVTASGQSGYFQYFQATCPSGPGGPFVTGPYVMTDGSMSVGSVSATVSAGEIVETDPGVQGSVCDEFGDPGAFSVTKNLNVSSLSNGSYTLSVTMCTTTSKCSTKTATVTINRPVTPPPPPTLTGSCSASPNPAEVGQGMIWTASRSGGTGSYTYSWSGTDGLSGNSQNINKTYTTTGTKNATVVITSGTQSITRNCSVTVEQGSPTPSWALSVTKAGTGSGTVTGPGISCGTDCGETNISDGTSVTLTASPASGSTFTGWSGACSGTASTCTVTMDGNKSVTATFDLEGTPPPTSTGTVTVRSYGLTMTWALTGPGGTINQTSRVSGPVTYSDMPVGTYTLVPANYAGYTYTITPSSSATLSQGQTLQFVVNYSPVTQQRTLTAAVNGTGSGSINSVPGGITCGAGTTNDCSEVYADGTSVTLTASPASGSGSTFTGWSGACSGTASTCTVTMDGNKSVTATFNTAPPAGNQYWLTVKKDGTGDGSVTSSPSGISCGIGCTQQLHQFDENTVVTLTASHDSASVFTNWTGHCTGTNPVVQVTMSDARLCTAHFETPSCGPDDKACPAGCENPPDPDCSIPGEGDITCTVTVPTPPEPASASEEITLTASGGSNYTWTAPLGCIPTGGSGSSFSAVCGSVGQKIFSVIGNAEDIEGPDTDQCVVQVVPQCSDGKDNADTEDDFADIADPACHTDGDPDNTETYDPDIESEINTVAQCADGEDNVDPEDELADEDDPGCHTDGDPENEASYDADDNDETDPTVPVCSDGLDNDGDGNIDWPDDAGCSSATDDNEQDPRFDEV